MAPETHLTPGEGPDRPAGAQAAARVERRTRRRITLLLLLLFAILVTRGVDMYHVLFHPNILLGLGFSSDYSTGHVTVAGIRDRLYGSQPSPAAQAGLRVGDRILEAYTADGTGGPLRNLNDFADWRRATRPGDTSTLVISREGPDATREERRLAFPHLPASVIPLRTRLLRVFLSVVLPLLTLVTAFFIGFSRPEHNNAFRAGLLFLTFSGIFGIDVTLFPPGLREFTQVFQITINTSLAFLFLWFFLQFPSPSVIARKARWLLPLGLGLTLFNIGFTLVIVFALHTSFARFARWQAATQSLNYIAWPSMLAMLLVGLASLILNTVQARTRDERRRLIIVLSGSLIGLLPLIAFVAYLNAVEAPDPAWWVIGTLGITIGLFPLSFIYAVVKHRVLGIRLILRRGLQYALVSRGFLVAEGGLFFLLFVFFAGPLLQRLVPDAGTGTVAVSSALVTLGLVASLREINRHVLPVIDRRFFREAYNAQQILGELSRTVSRLAAHPDQVLRLVTEKVSDALYPDRAAIFLHSTDALYLAAECTRADQDLPAVPALPPDTYQCFNLRERSETGEDVQVSVRECRRMTLGPDSLIARHLQRFATQAPEALEVYLDDPKSWLSALAHVGPESEQRYREKQLIDHLHARLLIPLASQGRVLGFLSLGERLSEEPYSRDDQALLLAVAEQTAIALDYSQLIGQVAEQERMNREIEIAKEVQEKLLPQSLPPMQTLTYAGVCRPALGVGGDYYDFLVPTPERLGIAVGDIAGKGISAALLMASLQALLRSHAPLLDDAPDGLIRSINRLMCDSTDTSKYATFFYGVYDDNQRRLTYVNAGHNHPMLLRPAGDAAAPGEAGTRIGDYDLFRLQTGGLAIGLFPDAQYQQESVQLRPGDLLLIFTDGITEARDSAEEEFGSERLAALAVEHGHLAPEALRDRILTAVDAHVGGAPPHDDLTLVVAKVV